MIPRSLFYTSLFKCNTSAGYKICISRFHHAKLTNDFRKQLCYTNNRIIWNRLVIRYESTTVYYKTVDKKVDDVIDLTEQTVKGETPTVNNEIVNIDVSSLPEIEQATTELLVQLTKLGEPTLASLGLARWTPPGLIQRFFEFLHVTFEIPWWSSIAITVLLVRLLMFPLVIKNQRHSIKMGNLMPRLTELQNNMTIARQCGNTYEAMKATRQLAMFMSSNNVNPGRSIIYNLVQGPVFVCFFWALRNMCNLPVESMTTGGMYWFTDLTLPDQYYLLPLITSSTLFATLQVGVAKTTLNVNTAMLPYIKYGTKLLPLISFPFIMNFPAGVLVYWATSNMISFVQVSTLKIPSVRTYFGIEIEQKAPVKTQTSSSSGKGFVGGIKQGYRNMKLAREVDDRERLDRIMFQKAGRTPPMKTYKENPLLSKQKQSQ